jgi:hypothetical protein
VLVAPLDQRCGTPGRWILRLALFNFQVKHTWGVDNAVADALSRMFEGKEEEETPEARCAALWQSLPLVYTSLEERQKEDPFCIDEGEDNVGSCRGSQVQISGGTGMLFPERSEAT